MNLNLRSFPSLISCACHFHTSSLQSAKPGAFMKKIMKAPTKKKQMYADSPILPTPDAFSQGAHEGRYSGNSRRSSVLNKLFMKHITDLMATGQNSHEFLGHGIEINRVKISPDFMALNVYWAAKGGDEPGAPIEQILHKNAGYLRHELSTLRVMGVVPVIRFVRDRQHAQLLELDARLSGADYAPVRPEARLRTRLELHAPLPREVRERLGRLVEDADEEPLPAMAQDVLGLDRAAILERLQKALRKAQGMHRSHGFEQNDALGGAINENPIDLGGARERRAAFKQFLEKREMLRQKMKKGEKNYAADLEYVREEMERNEEYFEKMDVFDRQEDDFVHEELDI